MIHKKISTILIIALLLFNSCEKDKITTDVTARGNVRNNCTGKGFANVEVEFLTRKKNTTSSSTTTTTDASGNFSFSGLDIHSSSKYSYALYIEDHNHYLIGEYGHSGIGPIEIDKDKISIFQQIGISASFKICTINLPSGIAVTPPDTFTLKFEQKTLHYYEPNRIYEQYYYPRFLNSGSLYSPNWGDYPMGLWHITFDKTKSGVHTVINDSIFLDMGATASYTVPW